MTSGSRSTRSTKRCRGFPTWPVAPPAPAKTRTTWLPWVALVALAAGVGVWEARRPATTPENPLANAQFTRFTDWEGTEGGAEISPDGKFVAFLADHDGRVRPLVEPGGHRAISRISRADIPPLGSQRVVHRHGSSAFRATGRRSGSVLGRRAIDGTDADAPAGRHATGVPGRGRHRPAWSPDGTRLVYFKNETVMIRCLSRTALAQTRARSS